MKTIFAVSGIVIKELYRRKDFYVLFFLTAVMTLLLGALNFFNDTHIVRYVKEISLLLIWISSLVIAITTTARQIPAERESRTIFPLLAKPISRAQLIVGKFLGCWFASGLALAVFYAFFALVVGSREPDMLYNLLLQAIWLHWVCLAVIVAMSLLGSLIFSSTASNATICFICVLGIMLLGSHLNKFSLKMSEFAGLIVSGVYYAMPHLEWYYTSDLVVHNQGVIHWLDVCGATLYGGIYTAVLLGAAWILFRRKSLA
jgi:ABC-type transport system involved in multi-copper enzyme maturation permease subunit